MDFFPAGIAWVWPNPSDAGSRSQHPWPPPLCRRGRAHLPSYPRRLIFHFPLSVQILAQRFPAPFGAPRESDAEFHHRFALLRALNTGFHARRVYLLLRPKPQGFPLLFGMSTPLGQQEKSSPKFIPLSLLSFWGEKLFIGWFWGKKGKGKVEFAQFYTWCKSQNRHRRTRCCTTTPSCWTATKPHLQKPSVG